MLDVVPKVLPNVHPDFEKLNALRNMGCTNYYDLSISGSKKLNLMGYNPDFPNLVQNPGMNVDSNGDGIVDNFIIYTFPATTISKSLDDNAQKITITSSTTTQGSILYQDIATLPEEVISAMVETRIEGNVQSGIYIEWYNGSTYLSETAITNKTNQTYVPNISENRTAPANTTKARLILITRPFATGDTGSAWFKNAKLIKNYRFKKAGDSAVATGATQKPNGMSFDGVDDKLTISNNYGLALQGDHSIELFLKHEEGVGYPGVISKSSGGVTGDGGYLIFVDKALKTILYKRNAIGVNTLNNTLLPSIWYHVIFTFNSTTQTVRSYLDAIYESSYTGDFNLSDSNIKDMTIGVNEANYFKGEIGLVRIFNKALTQPEITQLYNNDAWRYR